MDVSCILIPIKTWALGKKIAFCIEGVGVGAVSSSIDEAEQYLGYLVGI